MGTLNKIFLWNYNDFHLPNGQGGDPQKLLSPSETRETTIDWCKDSIQDNIGSNFICTLHVDHNGPHVGHFGNGTVAAIWTDKNLEFYMDIIKQELDKILGA